MFIIPQMSNNVIGLMVGLGAVVVTAFYQVLAGSKQKELGASSMQLLHQYCPMAATCLAILVPIFEPLGLVSLQIIQEHTRTGCSATRALQRRRHELQDINRQI